MTSASRFYSPLPRRAAVLALVAAAVLSAPTVSAAQQYQRTVPGGDYFSALPMLYEGEYGDALKQLNRMSVIRVPTVWIDSICRDAMMGECYYQMGRLDEALDRYTSALRIFLAYPDWMIRVRFPPTIRLSGTVVTVPWGPSTRGAKLGSYPDSLLMGLGQLDLTDTVRQGGVLQQAEFRTIQAQEIVRCTSLAIRRRSELLGPLGQHDTVTDELIVKLSRRPAPPNHWSQAWIDVELGLALAAAGKETEALPLLTRGAVAAGEFDHILSSTALFELGRMAFNRGELAAAIKFFHEASISAVYYPDPIVLEEAFRYGAAAHIASKGQGVYAPLPIAAKWTKVKDLRQFQASVLVSAAENYAVLNQAALADTTIKEAALAIGRRPMGTGAIGARLNYARALTAFQQGSVAAGDEALNAAVAFMRGGSVWLNQIRQLDLRFTGNQITNQGAITARTAMELYATLLRDPQPADWLLRPLDSLAVLMTPHGVSYEHWFLIALLRNDQESALEVAERARRHRFSSSLSVGGRLQTLRWILEAPDGLLDQQSLLQRQSLLTEYPAFARLSQEGREVRQALRALPLVPADSQAAQQQKKGLDRLGQIAVEQEAILRQIAVRREPASMVFPPFRTTKQIRESLPEGHAVLTFFEAGGDLYGFLVNREQLSNWRVRNASAMSRRIMTLLRDMGHHDANRVLTLDELADAKWQATAAELLGSILQGSRADFTADFPELAIVPDGALWYVPFEALQVNVGGSLRPLISRFRIRYAPTVSLAVPDGRAVNPAGQTVVVTGRLSPRADDSAVRSAFEEFSRSVPRSVSLAKGPLPGPSSLYRVLIDRLVVLDDLSIDGANPYNWAPIQIERGKPGNLLNDWLSLPWHGPEVMILPGFHTAAENSLRQVNTPAPGSEVFLTICGLMASGTKTILLSRWRTGGQSSFEIVREFAQELPHTSPADAWQRAVLVTADTRLDPAAEPRVQPGGRDPPKGVHPFFWAGYMLVDSGVGPTPVAGAPAAAGMKLQDAPPEADREDVPADGEAGGKDAQEEDTMEEATATGAAPEDIEPVEDDSPAAEPVAPKDRGAKPPAARDF